MKSALDHKKVRLARLVAESKADSSRNGLKVQSPTELAGGFHKSQCQSDLELHQSPQDPP